MMTTSYAVIGMTCEHCVNAVTEEVNEIEGVSVVSVDLESGKLTVTSEDAPDREAVRAAVDEAGYELA